MYPKVTLVMSLHRRGVVAVEALEELIHQGALFVVH